MTVRTRAEAWNAANRIFPTDYEPDTRASKNAGYPIYWSTAEGVNAWISDLNTALELNMPDGSTVRINIDDTPVWDYDGQY